MERRRPFAARNLLVLLCAALGLAGCVSPRGQEAADLLSDIAAGDAPSRLKEATPEPVRVTLRYRRAAGDATADLYRNSERPRGALVVVGGLTPYGKDDPRLVALARSLARVDFLVLVPDIANTRMLKVSASDAGFVADGIEELTQRFASAADRAIGLVAFSYAVGPALLAVSQTSAGRHVRFVVAVGGYHDIEAAIGLVTTGSYRSPDGSWRQGTPNEFGKFVFLRSNAERVADRADRDPDRVADLIARLPDAIRRELRALDLKARDLSAIAGPVFLIHGEDDAIIPSGESVGLAAALGPRAELYRIEHFAHIDAGTAGLGDSLRLWNAVQRVLAERERPE